MTTLLNKYEILEKIGEGGYGVIYKAKDILLDRIVAIKRIIDREYKEYFLKEGRLLAKLRHKNIIEIYTVETEERDDPLEGKTREIYLITEYVGGGNLLNYIDKHYYDIVNSNDNDSQRLKTLISGILKGIKYIHSQGIIHRDIKPENILIDKTHNRDIPKIGDFGISKVLEKKEKRSGTSSTTIRGTPIYIPPELFREDGMKYSNDMRRDIYALGIVIYYIIYKDLPFKGKTIEQIIPQKYKDITLPPLPIGIRKDKDIYTTLIKRAIDKDIDKRFSSIDEMLDILMGKGIIIVTEREQKREQKQIREERKEKDDKDDDKDDNEDKTVVVDKSITTIIKEEEEKDKTVLIDKPLSTVIDKEDTKNGYIEIRCEDVEYIGDYTLIDISGEPNGCKVYIDDKEIGKTPINDILDIDKDKYKDKYKDKDKNKTKTKTKTNTNTKR